MKYTIDDVVKVIKLADEFTKGNDSAEAIRLRKEIRLNAMSTYMADFIITVIDRCNEDND